MSSALMLLFFIALLFLGVPVVGAMGLGAIFYIVIFMDIPMNIIASQMYAGVNSIPLMAIPFFIIAGALMENGGISKRIVAFANSLVGHFPGGFGLAVVVASAFFAAMTGSGAACVAAAHLLCLPPGFAAGGAGRFVCGLRSSRRKNWHPLLPRLRQAAAGRRSPLLSLPHRQDTRQKLYAYPLGGGVWPAGAGLGACV